VRNFKGIQRRIQRLAGSSEAPEAPVANQAAEVLRHWRETGELSHPDGGRISLAVYRQIVTVEELERREYLAVGDSKVNSASEAPIPRQAT
jgi:hypothetical protein